jgi:predicted nucleic acid-binding Zn ribbon protein
VAVPWEPLRSDDDGAPIRVGMPLDRLMANLGGPKLSTVRSLFDRWPELVGPQVASQAEPRSLRDGVLVVAVEDPAWATQLRYLEAELLTRIAALFGAGEVSSIEVRVRRDGPAKRS